MGSQHKLNDPGTAASASAGAAGAATAASALSQQANQNAQAIQTMLYGPNGTMTQMANPANLNVTSPTGADAITNTVENENLSTDTQNSIAAANRQLANQGFGSGSGMAAEAGLKANLAEAQARGGNFATNTQNSYNKASQNFWNATNLESGNAAQQSGLAAATNANAGQIQNSLYGTAGQGYQTPGFFGNVAPVFQAAGQVGAAAACVSPGTRIRLHNRTEVSAGSLKVGDKLFGFHGAEEILAIESTGQPCVELTLEAGPKLLVSASHTFMVPLGGYIEAARCEGWLIAGGARAVRVRKVEDVGTQMVLRFRLGNVHTFLTENIWSLE